MSDPAADTQQAADSQQAAGSHEAAGSQHAVEGQHAVESHEALGYEQARAELSKIVRALETGGQPLEESLRLWQRGEELAAICSEWLLGARQRLESAIAATEERG